MKRTVLLVALASLIALPRPAGAQEAPGPEATKTLVTIILKSGKTLMGQLIGFQDGVFRVRTEEGVETVRDDLIFMMTFGTSSRTSAPPETGPPVVRIGLDENGALRALSRRAFEQWAPSSIHEAGDGISWEEAASLLGEAGAKAAPLKKPEREDARPAGFPPRLSLRWAPGDETCRFSFERTAYGTGEAGLSRALEALRRSLQGEDGVVMLDVGDDVPMSWTLSALAAVRALHPKDVLFSGSEALFENARFTSRIESAVRDRKEGDVTPCDAEIRCLVDPSTPFLAVAELLYLCAQMGAPHVYLGVSKDRMLKAFLPFDDPRQTATIPLDKVPGGFPGLTGERGIGGPPAGPFGKRRSARGRIRIYGVDRRTSRAVGKGLAWLARHQDPDGMWRCKTFMLNCGQGTCSGPGSSDDYDAGVTGLSLLAFLGAGHSDGSGKHEEGVRRAWTALKDRQTHDGCVGPKCADGHWIYNHAICTMALAEAFALSGQNPRFRAVAQDAVDFLVECQNPGMGWRYGKQTGNNDTSCTAWAAAALRSAKVAGLRVPEACFEGALRWFDRVTDEAYYKTGYTSKGDTGARLASAMGKFQPSEAMTAAAVTTRILLLGEGARNRPVILGGGNLLKMSPPRWDVEAGTIDMYYWYWGLQAMFQLGGNYWEAWNEPAHEALLSHQRNGGCAGGSWDPAGAWGEAGGRVYATAINTLTLETCFRYKRVLQEK